MSESSKVPGHAFLSYVREDSSRVDRLQRTLESSGIPVWRDTSDLWPGEDWRLNIRRAITGNALVFLACFSQASLHRARSYQNEELALAIEQLRQRRPDEPWLIPVRLDECQIPDWDIGGGRTLGSIQRADIFHGGADQNAERLVAVVKRILRSSGDVRAASIDFTHKYVVLGDHKKAGKSFLLRVDDEIGNREPRVTISPLLVSMDDLPPFDPDLVYPTGFERAPPILYGYLKLWDAAVSGGEFYRKRDWGELDRAIFTVNRSEDNITEIVAGFTRLWPAARRLPEYSEAAWRYMYDLVFMHRTKPSLHDE